MDNGKVWRDNIIIKHHNANFSLRRETTPRKISPNDILTVFCNLKELSSIKKGKHHIQLTIDFISCHTSFQADNKMVMNILQFCKAKCQIIYLYTFLPQSLDISPYWGTCSPKNWRNWEVSHVIMFCTVSSIPHLSRVFLVTINDIPINIKSCYEQARADVTVLYYLSPPLPFSVRVNMRSYSINRYCPYTNHKTRNRQGGGETYQTAKHIYHKESLNQGFKTGYKNQVCITWYSYMSTTNTSTCGIPKRVQENILQWWTRTPKKPFCLI